MNIAINISSNDTDKSISAIVEPEYRISIEAYGMKTAKDVNTSIFVHEALLPLLIGDAKTNKQVKEEIQNTLLRAVNECQKQRESILNRF